ncbi:MAG TPA: hypothetical protein VJ851_02275 [Jatrophihabitans sp.]|nr:hypothetical protein [Jatrophihabitans sp.]
MDDRPDQGTEPAEPTTVPGTVRLAAGLVGAEAVALLVVTVVLIALAVLHSSNRLWAALAIAAFALLGSLVLGLCARGLLGLRPSSRSPIVLIQLLALPVGYSLGIQAGRSAVGVPILAIAVAVLVVLFTPSARAALDRML